MNRRQEIAASNLKLLPAKELATMFDPRFVTVHGDPVAVVMAMETFKKQAATSERYRALLQWLTLPEAGLMPDVKAKVLEALTDPVTGDDYDPSIANM